MTALRKALLPLMFGVVMVGAAARTGDGWALAAAAALAAVAGGIWWRPAAGVAVGLTVLTVVLAAPAPLDTTLAGLAATAYLVTRHDAATVPTMTAAVGFATVTALVVAVPVEMPWLPLAAPLMLLAGYLLAVRPYLR